MKKSDINIRIIHFIFVLLNIGSLFFGIMVFSMGGNIVYSVFRELSLSFGFPIFLMRSMYLQYILFVILVILYMKFYKKNIKSDVVTRKLIIIDVFLWGVTIFELVFLELYFLNIRWF